MSYMNYTFNDSTDEAPAIQYSVNWSVPYREYTITSYTVDGINIDVPTHPNWTQLELELGE